ncbi:hypothetical protein LMG27952_03966 [Paraburkholderia hiiakae]|uniref:IraD/Gp25-like domain-containing protein n=1 Tax=Paraburkholderia hiiakae TaxID=1081782 RepID=A0ABM8NTM7_9BURK|nr:GPW/gp25 family protein [Paraburkholderia hiiakae]CAD6542978.1 hypothetical protein LMG27952_03966 [Paraburkholderia hiiakae]
MNLAYPYQYDPRGRTAETDDNTHLRDLIEQVLFTAPGERVMLPDFGCGVAQLVFAPNAFELASATQVLIQSALQRWLGALIVVQNVNVEATDATLSVTVTFRSVQDSQWQVQTFQQGAGGAA